MNIRDFVSKLLPTFGRDRIIEDLRITQGDLQELVAVYAEAKRLFESHKPKSEQVKDLFGKFKRIVGGKNADNAVVHIADHLPEILANVTIASELAKTYLQNNVAGAGLTIKQASIVRYVDGLYLISKYARKFLNYVYVYEAAQFPDLNSMNPAESIPKAEAKWIIDSMTDFCHAYMAALGVPQELIKDIENAPDIEVAKANHGLLETTLSPKQLDPRQMNFIGTNYNPIYYIRMVIAEWQVRRYKAAKEELTALQLRQVQLQKLLKGQADANIERKIAYTESRIQRLNYEIAEMEK